MCFSVPIFVRSGTAISEISEGAYVDFSNIEQDVKCIYDVLNTSDQYELLISKGKLRSKELLDGTKAMQYIEVLFFYQYVKLFS